MIHLRFLGEKRLSYASLFHLMIDQENALVTKALSSCLDLGISQAWLEVTPQ